MNLTAGAAPTALYAYEWINLFGLGGLAGALGQGARTVVGFKKLSDAASAANVPTAELVTAGRIFISLAIGFIAGALAAIWILDGSGRIVPEKIFALVAAGYAGADIIEGLITKVKPATGAPAGTEAIGVGTGGANGGSATAEGNLNDDAVG
jgi:hypothetical protein